MVLISNINQWWENLTSAHQVFWFIAIIFSVLFVIHFIFLLIGFDPKNKGFERPADNAIFEHEFSALSVRSIIAFFTFFGWTGVIAMRNQLNVWLAVVLSAITGLTAMFIIAWLGYKFSQLEKSGTLNLYNALDQDAEVFLSIPAAGKGFGKVHLKVDGKIRELDAITEGESLKAGTPVKVVEIMDGKVLKVEYMALSREKKAAS